ncbi:MAG TPA: bifunctional demethylmenaquinone methyltransferase/2-methoxy-6-polyprenyl-1,4-benzoquinol methylase, partial [Rhodobacteraceae bacterium]|nr:bifunctional demethylmenaquinone methyltransferase/2-methoxy-6-polyprenyl-1,4-benzoquinol methylase [Paracoccaceae bacterium]
MTEPQNTTHFGFKTIDENKKAGMVEGLFSSVANKYDLMNDAMSMGIHR